MMRTPAFKRPETGAALLVVLVVLLGVGLICSGLTSMTSTALRSSQSLNGDRDATFAAENAIEVAVQHVRYTSATYATEATCLSGGSAITTNAHAVTVRCSHQSSSKGREVEFQACQSSDPTCLQPTVTAVVRFEDNATTCTASTTSGCGQQATILSWVIDSDG
jgi:Tfp pilus assembly protein PilX